MQGPNASTPAGAPEIRGTGSTVERLAHLAQALAGARSAVDVARAIARSAPEVVDARFANVAVVEHGSRLRLLYNDAFGAEWAEQFETVSRKYRIPATVALERDETVSVPDLRSLVDDYPGVAESFDQLGMEALAGYSEVKNVYYSTEG